jgi:flagellin-like protein
MKILRSKKALSPVVASIILIAVTVAVSIAVAAWMGALTGGFMGSSSATITKVDFIKNGNATVNVDLTVKNTGTKTVTIVTVKVNNVEVAKNATLTLDPGKSGGIRLTLVEVWVAGNPYKFDLYDGSGQILGSYQATAPES